MRKHAVPEAEQVFIDKFLRDSRLDLDEDLQRALLPGCVVNHLVIKSDGFEVQRINCAIQQ